MDLPVNLPVAIVGAVLIMAGILYKMRITGAEQDELRRMRTRVMPVETAVFAGICDSALTWDGVATTDV